MEIIHRISYHINSKLQLYLKNIGIVAEKGFTTFEISESDDRWKSVEYFIKQYDVFEYVYTKFTKKEIHYSNYLEIIPDWHLGYPMPDGDLGYLELTYKLDDYCFKCGIGKIQKSPFRMKNEPGWGERHILQLNWIFDEYFIRPEIYNKIFEPLGVEKIPVLHYKTEKELETVVQIKIDRNAEVGLNIYDLPFEKCKECNRIKYLPHTRGMFPKITRDLDNYIFKTKEYFGSGASANKNVIINKELYRKLIENKIKGIHFKPVMS